VKRAADEDNSIHLRDLAHIDALEQGGSGLEDHVAVAASAQQVAHSRRGPAERGLVHGLRRVRAAAPSSSPVLLQYARTAMGLSLGARFGRHELLTANGSGSRGVACQTPGARLAPHAAIEFGPPQIDSDPHFRGHFDCEAKAIAALNQPPARGLPVYGPRERHRPCAHGVVSGIPRR